MGITVADPKQRTAKRVDHRLVFGFTLGIFLQHSKEQLVIQRGPYALL